MNAQTVSPQNAKAVARRIFTQLYHDQEEWFDLAWDCCAESRGSSQSIVPSTSAVGLGAVGAANDVSRLMAQQFADLAATFLIHSPVARSELLAKLQNNLAKREQPDALVAWLIQSATTTLDQLSAAETVFVTSLLKDRLARNRECEIGAFENTLRVHSYDIVVNEPKHSICIQGRDGIVPPEIIKVAPMQRGMLWLVLTHVGDLLEHKEIGDLFDFDPTEPSESLRQKDKVVNKVYQYPVALREMVGENLYRRILKTGAGRANQVARENWSFFWARKFRDERGSELLHGMSESVRWSKRHQH